jgi:hypothetical protein
MSHAPVAKWKSWSKSTTPTPTPHNHQNTPAADLEFGNGSDWIRQIIFISWFRGFLSECRQLSDWIWLCWTTEMYKIMNILNKKRNLCEWTKMQAFNDLISTQLI